MTLVSQPSVNQPPVRTHHVLLAEDSAADVFLLETSIEISDIPLQLSVAADGVIALEVLEQQLRAGGLPELLLLDLNMPRMNGFEVLAALRARSEYLQLPVVVLTTSAASIDRTQVQELGAKAFVTKPMGFEDVALLLQRIIAVLRGQLTWEAL